MRVNISPWSVTIWLSARDTYAWAHKPGAWWPCSQLSGKRLVACFDATGLYDMAINGRASDCDANEFNAIMADHLTNKLPADHPAWFVTVGQFQHN